MVNLEFSLCPLGRKPIKRMYDNIEHPFCQVPLRIEINSSVLGLLYVRDALGCKIRCPGFLLCHVVRVAFVNNILTLGAAGVDNIDYRQQKPAEGFNP